jgi:hypothetical protein
VRVIILEVHGEICIAIDEVSAWIGTRGCTDTLV